MHSRFSPIPFLVIVATAGIVVVPAIVQVHAQELDGGFAEGSANEKAMAIYADAANFQTGGAIPLAIDGWKKFLREYPQHEMASQASHYLGVCYMQQAEPDYDAASEAFLTALSDKDYDLREESLANCGWCLYSSAGQAPHQDKAKLRKSIEIFDELRKAAPDSDFLDRAWFYTGEAHYGLGEAAKAVEAYNSMLASPQAKKSTLRCDALYARGVAFEDLKKFTEATASFRQLLSACADDDLVTDVHLRMGDLAILRSQFDDAVQSFQQAIESTKDDEDRAYAVFRQAFAHAKADRSDEASKLYELLLDKYKDSAYAASATLASAQSAYRTGNFDLAAERFEKVMQQNSVPAATEAAHWLARIHFSKPDPAAAMKVARQQLTKGGEGDFFVALKLDVAEAYSADPKTTDKAFDEFSAIYRQHPKDPLASRALYNAAFFALRLNRPDDAIALADEFARQFTSDTLSSDVASIAAESYLAKGDTKQAASTYQKLLASPSIRSNPQRPLWIIRGAASLLAAGSNDEAIGLLREPKNELPDSAQKAEAELLIGQAHLNASRPGEATKSLESSLKLNNEWARAEEVALLLGTALLADDKKSDAERVWTRLTKSDDRMADQALFKLGQLAMTEGDTNSAVARFDKILDSKRDLSIVPYAVYAKTRALLQSDDFAGASLTVGKWLESNADHPLRTEALMSHGIALRGLEKFDDATKAFDEAISRKPVGGTLASILYEAAVNDVANKQPETAVKKLRRIMAEVPNYKDMDQVANELAWALRDAGKSDAATEQFKSLITAYPESDLAANAAYALAQQLYKDGQWGNAAEYYDLAATKANEDSLSEKSLYRLGWAHFKNNNMEQSREAFRMQRKKHPTGRFVMDALMMTGESSFKAGEYDQALTSYTQGRVKIREANESSKTLSDASERRIRELILLHGGQSAAQLKKWQESLQWYGELRERFPSTAYLSQVYYETGFTNQQMGNDAEALKFYGQVVQKNPRSSIAARAQFMIGEIHFSDKRYDQAITEFQRVMYGYGADKASKDIKIWQAKSGYEAGRCSEAMLNQAKTTNAKTKAKAFAIKFYDFVIQRHPESDIVEKAKARLTALQQ